MTNLTITNEILYKEMQKINTSQARGEEKLVGIEKHLERINGRIDKGEKHDEKQDEKIEEQSNWRYKTMGQFSVIIIVVSIAISYILN